jgi:hypothetical protein
MIRVLLSLAAGLALAHAATAGDAKAPAPGTPLALVTHEKVRKELKLSADQVDKVKALKGEGAQEKLARVLEPAQIQRLREISLQVRGGAALKDSAVADELKLTRKQKADVAEAQSDADRTLPMFLQVARFRNAQAKKKYIRNHYKQAAEKMLAVLTEEQKKQFTKMQGKTFDTAGLDQ